MRSKFAMMMVGVLSCFAAASAHADVVMGYQVNSSPQQANFTYNGTTLTLTSPTTVDFHLTVNGSPVMFDDATLTFSATKTFDFVDSFDTYLFFDGSFSITKGSNVLTWDFVDALMVVTTGVTSTSLDWSSSVSAGTLTSGPALASALGAGSMNFPGDFSFSFASMIGDASSFMANTSFAAQVQYIPEPASIALLAPLAVLGLRRGRARRTILNA